MGALTASGSLARVLGPLAVSSVYNEFGLYATSGLVVALMLVTLVVTVATYRRLVPFSAVAVATAAGEGGEGDKEEDLDTSTEAESLDSIEISVSSR